MKSLTAPWICGLLFLATASCSSSAAPQRTPLQAPSGRIGISAGNPAAGGGAGAGGGGTIATGGQLATGGAPLAGNSAIGGSTPGVGGSPIGGSTPVTGGSPTGGTIVGTGGSLTGGSTVATGGLSTGGSVLRTGGSAIGGATVGSGGFVEHRRCFEHGWDSDYSRSHWNERRQQRRGRGVGGGIAGFQRWFCLHGRRSACVALAPREGDAVGYDIHTR